MVAQETQPGVHNITSSRKISKTKGDSFDQPNSHWHFVDVKWCVLTTTRIEAVTEDEGSQNQRHKPRDRSAGGRTRLRNREADNDNDPESKRERE